MEVVTLKLINSTIIFSSGILKCDTQPWNNGHELQIPNPHVSLNAFGPSIVTKNPDDKVQRWLNDITCQRP